jgi:hypothetical protein
MVSPGAATLSTKTDWRCLPHSVDNVSKLRQVEIATLGRDAVERLSPTIRRPPASAGVDMTFSPQAKPPTSHIAHIYPTRGQGLDRLSHKSAHKQEDGVQRLDASLPLYPRISSIVTTSLSIEVALPVRLTCALASQRQGQGRRRYRVSERGVPDSQLVFCDLKLSKLTRSTPTCHPSQLY